MIDEDPLSPQLLRMIHGWIDECRASHPECLRSPDAVLPARVVDVGDGDGNREIKVVRVGDIMSRSPLLFEYLALSYCWGPAEFFRTTFETLAASEKGIDLDALPPTIRDAVTVTQKLGFCYLWVDSLCILQGSDEDAQVDWRRESGKMKDIYGGAFLTIRAASARSALDGFLKPRTAPTVPAAPFARVPHQFVMEDELITGSVEIGGHRILTHSSEEPLSRRAWALQESVLSKRLLTFGTTETSFSCQRFEIRESGQRLWGSGGLQVWHSVVEDYTSRDLTRPSDRLPAIAGFADHFGRSTRSEYLEGLWSESLPRDLLWSHIGKPDGRVRRYPFPEQYRAPSWSWASVDGGIKFLATKHTASSDLAIIGIEEVVEFDASQNRDVNVRVLKLRGKLAKIRSIKCAAKASYDGLSSEDCSLVCLGSSLKTHLDRISQWKHLQADGGDAYIYGVWFLELSASVGLILLPKNRKATQEKRKTILERLGLVKWRNLPTEFQRIGVYSCDHPGDLHAAFDNCEISDDTLIY